MLTLFAHHMGWTNHTVAITLLTNKETVLNELQDCGFYCEFGLRRWFIVSVNIYRCYTALDTFHNDVKQYTLVLFVSATIAGEWVVCGKGWPGGVLLNRLWMFTDVKVCPLSIIISPHMLTNTWLKYYSTIVSFHYFMKLFCPKVDPAWPKRLRIPRSQKELIEERQGKLFFLGQLHRAGLHCLYQMSPHTS